MSERGKGGCILHIIIITFERVDDLCKTISALLKYPSSRVRITVIDNNSSDATPEYLENISISSRGRIEVVRNHVNIGACANVMRAYELASGEYFWLICDDDECDFGGFDRILDILDSQAPDVVVAGSLQKNNDEYKAFANRCLSMQTLSDTNLPRDLSFLPMAIIKTKSLMSCDFTAGYALSHTHFPQYFWISEAFNANWTVHLMAKSYISRSSAGHGLPSNLFHFNGFVRAIKLFDSRKVQSSSLRAYVGGGLVKYAVRLARHVIADKIRGKFSFYQYWSHIIEIPLWARAFAIFMLPTTFIPSFIYKFLTQRR